MNSAIVLLLKSFHLRWSHKPKAVDLPSKAYWRWQEKYISLHTNGYTPGSHPHSQKLEQRNATEDFVFTSLTYHICVVPCAQTLRPDISILKTPLSWTLNPSFSPSRPRNSSKTFFLVTIKSCTLRKAYYYYHCHNDNYHHHYHHCWSIFTIPAL